MTNLKLVIMAAGMGSRFGSLKQIDEIGPSGEFIMDYAVYDAYLSGVREVCVVVRSSFKEQIEIVINSRWEKYTDLKFTFICQEIADIPAGSDFKGRLKPWGTAHVLYTLRNTLTKPFIIMNADDFYGREAIQNLVKFMNTHQRSNALMAYPLKSTLSLFGPVTRGLCNIEDEKLKAIDEVGEIHHGDLRQELVSMNLWGFSEQIFPPIIEEFEKFIVEKSTDAKAEYQIPQVINDLLKRSKLEIHCLQTNSQWCGVTYKEDKVDVQNKITQFISDKSYPENLFLKA